MDRIIVDVLKDCSLTGNHLYEYNSQTRISGVWKSRRNKNFQAVWHKKMLLEIHETTLIKEIKLTELAKSNYNVYKKKYVKVARLPIECNQCEAFTVASFLFHE